MANRLILLGLAVLLLAGCGLDRTQSDLCRSILPALAESGATVTASDDLGWNRAGVGLSFQDGAGAAHRMECRFGGGRLSERRLALLAVTLDGAALPESRMIFLRRVFGLPPPAEAAADPAAPPPPLLPYFLQQFINGLTLGAMLALVAVGYSLIYGITGTIQFAFGEIFMIGAYLMVILFFAGGAAGISALAILLALAVAGSSTLGAFHGWAMERTIYRTLRDRGTLASLIAALGLSVALQNYVRLAQGAQNKWLPALLPDRWVLYEDGGFDLGLSLAQVTVLGLAISATAGLAWHRHRTASGRAQRACADDPAMAALLGVDVGRTIARTFALGGGLAALAGSVAALYYGEADFMMGTLMGFKALTAALLGGFGSLGGALLGGLLLGLFETFWSAYFGLAYKDAAIFGLLILILVFRPQGLLGSATRPQDRRDAL